MLWTIAPGFYFFLFDFFTTMTEQKKASPKEGGPSAGLHDEVLYGVLGDCP